MEIEFERDAADILKQKHIYIPIEVIEKIMTELAQLAESNKKILVIMKTREE